MIKSALNQSSDAHVNTEAGFCMLSSFLLFILAIKESLITYISRQPVWTGGKITKSTQLLF